MSELNGTTAALESATPILTRVRWCVREALPHSSGAGFVVGPLVVHFNKTYSRQVRRAFELGREAGAYGYVRDDDRPAGRANLRVVR